MTKKISELTAATTPLAGTELVEIVQSGTSKKVAVSEFSGGVAREILAANRTYYVRIDGSDSNNGLANTSGGAFLTIQKAANVITETLDLASYTVTIQLDDRTYTEPITLRRCLGRGGFGVAILQGNAGSPGNVIISTTNANAILVSAGATEWLVKDLKVQTTTAGNGLYSSVNAYVSFQNVVFGACANAHLYAAHSGTLVATGNYSITGGAANHFNASLCGRLTVTGRTVTLTGTPAFSIGFASSSLGGVVACGGNSFSGSATGKRYAGITSNGVVDTSGGGASYLPGGTAGDAPTTGGQYL